MQNQELKPEYVLLSVPAELLTCAGIFEGDAITMHVEGGRLVIESSNPFICSGDCENCPMGGIDCEGECGDCPCSESCDESEVK